jgi:hypothetical protein
MPRIIVQAEEPGGTLGAPTLVERTVPVGLQNEHYIAQLIERLSWALIDAERLESDTSGDETEGQPRGQNRPIPGETAASSAVANPARTRVVARPATAEGST